MCPIGRKEVCEGVRGWRRRVVLVSVRGEDSWDGLVGGVRGGWGWLADGWELCGVHGKVSVELGLGLGEGLRVVSGMLVRC
jgi:hypothetical protein